MKNYYLILVLSLFIFNSTYSQKITGDWHGLRKYPDLSLRLIFNISKSDSCLSVNCDSPNMDNYDLKMDSITYDCTAFYLQNKVYNVSFRGIVDLKFQTITGIYKDRAGDMYDMTMNTVFSHQVMGRTKYIAKARRFSYY